MKRYGKRSVEFTIPMFQGYVFAQIQTQNKITLLESRHSAQIITPDDKTENNLVFELNDIRRLIQATVEGKLLIRPEIKVGNVVQIRSGPLVGLSGIVSLRNKLARITVNVEMIGYSVSVDLDANEVEIEY